MKKQLISSLILISLLILAVGIHANISFNSSSTVPVISDGSFSVCTYSCSAVSLHPHK